TRYPPHPPHPLISAAHLKLSVDCTLAVSPITRTEAISIWLSFSPWRTPARSLLFSCFPAFSSPLRPTPSTCPASPLETSRRYFPQSMFVSDI
ncbi:hypothetical protein B296_00055641, partial [Ensete ventricosum]